MNATRVEKHFFEVLVVSNAYPRASRHLEGCMKIKQVIWDEFR